MGGDLNNLYVRHQNSFFKFHDVEADGNCMYYCLAQCPATPLRTVEDIRRVLAKMMRKPSEHLLNFFVEYHKSDENPEPSLEKWQNTVMKDTEWGSNFESSLFGAIYGVDVRIITNSPSGLEECNTRTLLEMYEVDSEKMIPKDAPTFYLYLHKHMNPHQPTQKPNHFAILDPIDYQPPEGSVIYNHPADQQIDGTTTHSESTKESLDYDVKASNSLSRIDGNNSNPRFDGNGSGSRFEGNGSIRFDGNNSGPRLDGSSTMSRFDASVSLPRFDGNNNMSRFDGNISNAGMDGNSSNAGMMSVQQQKRRRPGRQSEQNVSQRRNSLEMSALSNVLSEISTYDRAEVNRGHDAKKIIQSRRSSMQDRKNWGSVMSEMELHHSTSELDLLPAEEQSARQEPARDKIARRRSEISGARADNREERSQSRQRRAPQTGDSSSGRRSRPEPSSERRNANIQSERISSEQVHESTRESPSTRRSDHRSVGSKPKRPENSDLRHHRQEGDRNDSAREPRRSQRPREEVSQNDSRASFAFENLPSRQKGSSQRSLENTERSERTTASSSSSSRTPGGMRSKRSDSVSHRTQDIAIPEYSDVPSRGREAENEHSRTANTRSISRHTNARDEGSVSSRGSKPATSVRPSTSKSRDEENDMSRDIQSGRRSRDDESVTSRGSKASSRRPRDDDGRRPRDDDSRRPRDDDGRRPRDDDSRRSRDDDSRRPRDDDSTKMSRPKAELDIPQHARTQAQMRRKDDDAMAYNIPMRPNGGVDELRGRPARQRTTIRQTASSKSPRRSTMSMQNDSNVNRQNDRRPTSNRSERRSTMSMQSDSNSNGQMDRRHTTIEKQQRLMSSAPGNGQSRSPRRSSMPVQQDGRRRVRSSEDDFNANDSGRGGYTDEMRSKVESSRSQRSNGSYASTSTATKVRTNPDDRQRRNTRRSMEMGPQSQYRPEVRTNRESPTRSEGKTLRGTAAWAANIEGKSDDQPPSRVNGSPGRQNNRRQRATSNQPVPRHFELYDSLE